MNNLLAHGDDMTGFENNFAYAIVNTEDISQAMINCVKASVNIINQLDLRKSLDGSKTVVKFRPNIGDPFSTYQWYSLGEITPLLQGIDWYNPGLD